MSDYLVGKIPERDVDILTFIQSVPTGLLRGMYKGEEVTFVILVQNECGDILDDRPDDGDACIVPIAILHGLQPEDLEHCADPDGDAPMPGCVKGEDDA